jgi:hypothetical protein
VLIPYRFDIHYYGPYCDVVARDVEWLIADAVVADGSTNREKYSNYKPGPALPELLARYADQLQPYRQAVRSVVQTFLPLSPERLELIATLHYLYREQKASGRCGPWKNLVLARFHEVKKDKFPVSELSGTYDQMVVAKLLEP